MKHRGRRRHPRGPFLSVAAYLTATGETQEQLAAAVGTTQAQISRIAAGEVIPRPALALRIANHCHLPIESFTKTYLARRQRRERGAAV